VPLEPPVPVALFDVEVARGARAGERREEDVERLRVAWAGKERFKFAST
jgi:hypothetical protein